MRLALIAVCCLSIVLAIPELAHAEPGYRAKFTSTITITEQFVKLMQQADSTDNAELRAADMQIEPLVGNLYFTKSKLRMDYPLPMSGAVVTTLVDFDTKKYMLISHGMRLAWEIDFAAFEVIQQQIGMPVSYPDQLFCRFEDFRKNIEVIPGVKLVKLGQKTVASEVCRGVRFSANLQDVFKADGFAPVDSVAPLKSIKGPWVGVFWISERFGLPMTMKSTMLGVEYDWSLSAIEDWQAIPALLQVPRGYKIEPLDPGQMIEALSLTKATP